MAGVGLVATRDAGAAAISLTTPGTEYNSGAYTLGFEFTVNADFVVTSLGVYDSGQNGLNNAANVGIWLAEGGGPLTQAVVGAGTAGRLDNYFRYVDVGPLTLTAGVHYVIGSFLNGDLATSFGTGQGGAASVNSLVAIVRDRFSPFDHAFNLPSATNFYNGGAWVGANFDGQQAGRDVEVDVTPVPEPMTLVLVGLTLLISASRIRRKV